MPTQELVKTKRPAEVFGHHPSTGRVMPAGLRANVRQIEASRGVRPAVNEAQISESDQSVCRLGLYVHIPFCLTKCTYCDFNTYAGIENMVGDVVNSLDTELRIWSSRPDITEFSSVFFGGGTPSYIPPAAIRRLTDTARTQVGIADRAEVTIEANPDDVRRDTLIQWRDAGINRLSIGVQSFEDDLLSSLSRRHSARDALDAIYLARNSGFDNTSIDLMYGLPNQTLMVWTDTLNTAIDLGLPHISLYCLQIEPSTPMHHSVKSGALPIPDDDLAADMYELAMDSLDDAGYEHYEISNWCLPDMRCAHNVGYWQNSNYLGIGPGAHSNLAGTRFWNVKSPKAYINAIRDTNKAPIPRIPEVAPNSIAVEDVEPTSDAMQMAETMMLGLRLREGISFAEFRRRFGIGLREVFTNEIADLCELGLIEIEDERVRLTRRGRMLGNEVFQQFV